MCTTKSWQIKIALVILQFELSHKEAQSAQLGESCNYVGQPCDANYESICGESKTCECHKFGKIYENKCVSVHMFGAYCNSEEECAPYENSVCGPLSKICMCKPWTTWRWGNAMPPTKCWSAQQGLQLNLCDTDNVTCGRPEHNNLCLDGVCNCRASDLANRYNPDRCDNVLNMDCRVYGVFQRCQLLANAKCQTPPRLGYPVCQCNEGYASNGEICVKSQSAPVIAPITGAVSGTNCNVLGGACDSAFTLFCRQQPTGSPQCNCRYKEQWSSTTTSLSRCQVAFDQLSTRNCTVCNGSKEICHSSGRCLCQSKYVFLEDKCQGALGKQCDYATVMDNCRLIDKASCAVLPRMAVPLCSCADGFQADPTETQCIPAVTLPPDELGLLNAKPSGNNTNPIKISDAEKNGSKSSSLPIIIGAAVGGLLLLGLLGFLIFFLNRRKPKDDPEKTSGNSGASDGSGSGESKGSGSGSQGEVEQ